MVITLSKHALDAMTMRRIKLGYIERTVCAPERFEPDPKDPALTRSLRSIAEFGGRVLRVVHRPDGDDIKVITAMWDRGAKL